ncbi:MAG: hypothetical protein LBK63_06950 [Treponema sp.]|jgi:hypothetical protein|nr:hypothetical protein [Treponema sp.]
MENNDRIKAIELALKLIEVCGPAAMDLTKDKADHVGELIKIAERIEQFISTPTESTSTSPAPTP